jgi:hypothetical protein
LPSLLEGRESRLRLAPDLLLPADRLLQSLHLRLLGLARSTGLQCRTAEQTSARDATAKKGVPELIVAAAVTTAATATAATAEQAAECPADSRNKRSNKSHF